MSDFEDTPSVGFLLKWTVVASLLLGIFIILPASMVLGVTPAWMSFQRDTQKQSHQYVEGKETMLLQWVAEYDRVEVEALKYEDAGKQKLADGLRLQQGSLLARIQTEAQRIPADALPPSVTTFLEKHSS